MRAHPPPPPVLSRTAFLCVVAFACAERSARAAGGAANDAYDDIAEGEALDVHGAADLYFQHSFDTRGPVQLRAFDDRTEVPAVGLVRMTLAHRPGLLGARVDADVGDTANGYLDVDPGAAAYPTLSRALSYVQQAFVTAVVPVGRGLSMDFGKFGTPVGFEENEALKNWSYSRGLLYTFAEPTYHFGLRVSYPLAEGLSLAALWTNGWNANVLGGNGMRTFAAAATWKVLPCLEVTLVYMGGPERAPRDLASPDLAFRSTLDGFVTYEVTPRFTVVATADYVVDAHGSGESWWGVGGYARYELLSFLSGTVRAEHLEDEEGFSTGTKQTLAELTGTIEARAVVHHVTLAGRLEYRRDQSDARVFGPADASGAGRRQDTLTTALLLAF